MICRDIDLFSNKQGEPTEHGFAEVVSKSVARKILKKINADTLKLNAFPNVEIKPAQTDIDRNRNWALREAESLIRASPASNGKQIKVERKQNRGIHVDGKPAFTQADRFAKNGIFHGDFSTLSLPS